MRRYFLLLLMVGTISLLRAQTITIPAFTGYAVPAENESTQLFSEKNGVQQWTNAIQKIQYFLYVRRAGKLSLALDAKNDRSGSVLRVSIAGKDFVVKIPSSKKFTKIKVGTVSILDSGFYSITVSVVKKASHSIADIRSILVSGAAAANAHYNAKPRRNAASVHLRYPLADSLQAIAFYNELTIPAGYDPLHSYYMACGFDRGYLGIQVNSPTERRVIFSVWDAGDEAIDRNKVADSNKVQLIAKGEDVIASGFGEEGTGGHSHWVFPWKTEQTYHFLVTAVNDSASKTTIYAGYIFMPEIQRWKLIASFKAPKDGQTLRNLYSFNENFEGVNGQLPRKAFFGNQWIQRSNGRWFELTTSRFSYDATGKAGDRIDYGAGVDNGKFYLWNGGFQTPTAKFGDVFTRPATTQRPMADLSKNADSAVQMTRDQQIILAAVASRKIDTTGSTEGVYYQVLKEGTGPHVLVTDTVSVFYKGSLLSNGFVFDATKDKPAVFPLKRLIKGWQIGLPQCKVGGKIRLYIPSPLAYHIRNLSKDIPPNSIMVFDIEVLSVKK